MKYDRNLKIRLDGFEYSEEIIFIASHCKEYDVETIKINIEHSTSEDVKSIVMTLDEARELRRALQEVILDTKGIPYDREIVLYNSQAEVEE